MYNGRQNIQTESIHDQLVQKNLYVDTKWRKKKLVKKKNPSNERRKHLAEREIYTELNSSYLTRKY